LAKDQRAKAAGLASRRVEDMIGRSPYEPVMDAPILPVLEELFSLAADLRKIANIAIRIQGIRT
jgi:hypothetical protein